jgi:hypothetical protein
MAKNYDVCFAKQRQTPQVDSSLWNDFRTSTVDYLTSTEPDTENALPNSARSLSRALFGVFKKVEVTPGVGSEKVRLLVLELIQRFQCDWTWESVRETSLTINQELALQIDENALRAAFGAGS